MSPLLRFEKWGGLGNDFLVVDLDEASPDPELARRLCDRRLGVGADGLLYVDRSAPRMILLNADGSRPEMCGNGLRCLVGFLGPSAARPSLAVQTDAGLRTCSPRWAGPDEVAVRVDMGQARFDPPLRLELGGRIRELACVDMGNPHAITLDAADQVDFDAWAGQAATHPDQGTNVELAQLQHDALGSFLDVLVWERGVGRTLACGTGACASAALACLRGLLPYDRELRVRLPGGELAIEVRATDHRVLMTGPARRVFRGQVAL